MVYNLVLGVYCCVTDHSKIWLKTLNIYYLTVSVSPGHKFGSGLAGWFWVKISHEVAVKKSTRAMTSVKMAE